MSQPAPSLKRFAWLSIAAALLTIGLKTWAWRLTGSVGLMSDALESLVNLAGAVMALWMITIAERPPDEQHMYGHGKAEFFASGFEGGLILLAALGIIYAAVERLFNPQPIEQFGLGVAVSAVAAVVNLGTGLVLLAAGRRYGSITLEADAQHLLADVWTSVGVIIGLGAVTLTGWYWLDPVLALAVGVNIVFIGWQLVHRSTQGLMDAAIPADQQSAIEAVLAPYREQGLDFHALRTRQAGVRSFVSMHVLVPGAWTVQQGHDLLERIEAEVRAAVPRASVFTHIEPLEDPVSLADQSLDRGGSP